MHDVMHAPARARDRRPGPRFILVDDGGLDDVADVVRALGLPLELLSAGRIPAMDVQPGTIIVARAVRALEVAHATARQEALVRVAVMDGKSRTTRNTLQRSGIDYLVHRPVHPDALRLFFARLVWRGPERRIAPRVAVGARTTMRAGLRRRTATIVEASITGCRLLLPMAIAAKASLKLWIPDDDGGAFTLRARVVRAKNVQNTACKAVCEVGVQFDRPGAAERLRLETWLRNHGAGPAAWPEPIATRSTGPAERRRAARLPFVRRIIAIADGRARVLLGRDLSAGAVCVDAGEELPVDAQLTLALHSGDGREPIVVEARVARVDSAGARVLRFESISEEAAKRIAELLDAPQCIESIHPDARAAGRRVLTEIVSRD